METMVIPLDQVPQPRPVDPADEPTHITRADDQVPGLAAAASAAVIARWSIARSSITGPARGILPARALGVPGRTYT